MVLAILVAPSMRSWLRMRPVRTGWMPVSRAILATSMGSVDVLRRSRMMALSRSRMACLSSLLTAACLIDLAGHSKGSAV